MAQLALFHFYIKGATCVRLLEFPRQKLSLKLTKCRNITFVIVIFEEGWETRVQFILHLLMENFLELANPTKSTVRQAPQGFLSDPSPIIGNPCQWLSNWLTSWCLVDLIVVTLACEDANSKLVEVVTVADVADEDRVGNSLLHI